MQRLAVLSDVNANAEALSAVLDDAEVQGVRDLLFLGDAVGYGPDPVECVSRLRTRAGTYLCGRLEDLMIHHREGELSPSEQRMLSHTRDTLRSASDHWEWLCNRPHVYAADGVMAVPVNPRGSAHESLILDNLLFGATPVSPLFSLVPNLLLVGGNHQPWILLEDGTGQTEKEVGFEYKLPGTGKAIVSVGSVGQPRDGDPRACYVILSDEAVVWRRVGYDIDRTAAKIEATESLSRQYAMRLREGI